jgi:hypothetical protein
MATTNKKEGSGRKVRMQYKQLGRQMILRAFCAEWFQQAIKYQLFQAVLPLLDYPH